MVVYRPVDEGTDTNANAKLENLSFKLFLLGELFKKQKETHRKQLEKLLSALQAKEGELERLGKQNRVLLQIIHNSSEMNGSGIKDQHYLSLLNSTTNSKSHVQLMENTTISHNGIKLEQGVAFRDKVIVKFNSFSVRRHKTGKYALFGDTRKSIEGNVTATLPLSMPDLTPSPTIEEMIDVKTLKNGKGSNRNGSLLLKFRRNWITDQSKSQNDPSSLKQPERFGPKRGTLTSLFAIEEEFHIYNSGAKSEKTLCKEKLNEDSNHKMRKAGSTSNIVNNKLKAVLSLRILPALLSNSTLYKNGGTNGLNNRHSMAINRGP